MTPRLPEGLAEVDDVATTMVAARALVHRPRLGVTDCGQPMWAMRRVAAGHMATLSCRWCPRCWPQQASTATSGWLQMLALAHLPFADANTRRGFGFLNSPASAGLPLNERSGR